MVVSSPLPILSELDLPTALVIPQFLALGWAGRQLLVSHRQQDPGHRQHRAGALWNRVWGRAGGGWWAGWRRWFCGGVAQGWSPQQPGGLGMGRQEAHSRVPLPSFSPPLPRVLHPRALCGRPAPLPAPPGCHALPLCTGSLLGTAGHPALLKVPQPLPSCLLRSSPCRASPLPCAAWSSHEVLATGLRGCSPYSGVGLAPGGPLPAYSRLFLPFCCSSLGGGGGTDTTSVRLRARGSPPTVTALPWHDTVPTPAPALHRDAYIHVHTCTHTHTYIAPSHEKPAEDAHRWASRFSPQGVGQLTLAPWRGLFGLLGHPTRRP
nr:uncharacterized protein LOC106847711 [Equus asinus]